MSSIAPVLTLTYSRFRCMAIPGEAISYQKSISVSICVMQSFTVRQVTITAALKVDIAITFNLAVLSVGFPDFSSATQEEQSRV